LRQTSIGRRSGRGRGRSRRRRARGGVVVAVVVAEEDEQRRRGQTDRHGAGHDRRNDPGATRGRLEVVRSGGGREATGRPPAGRGCRAGRSLDWGWRRLRRRGRWRYGSDRRGFRGRWGGRDRRDGWRLGRGRCGRCRRGRRGGADGGDHVVAGIDRDVIVVRRRPVQFAQELLVTRNRDVIVVVAHGHHPLDLGGICRDSWHRSRPDVPVGRFPPRWASGGEPCRFTSENPPWLRRGATGGDPGACASVAQCSVAGEAPR
jgi:hypothetical protein